jgi:hypothetical protein
MLGPDKQGEVVYVWVGVEDICDSMVGVVTVFPPIYGKTTEDVTKNVTKKIIEFPAGGESMMACIVSQPS